MNEYLQYVHNLKGASRFDHMHPQAREAVVSLLLRQIEDTNTIQKTIIEEAGQEVLDHISGFLDLKSNYKSIILSTETSSYVEEVDFNNVFAIINFRKINRTQRPNKLFRSVNTLLPHGGMYIGRIDTYGDRKLSFFRKYGKIVGEAVWLADFAINRVMPRLNLIDRVYYWFTKGRLHCISTPELMGRLAYCGFDIIDIRSVRGVTYFVAIKTREPVKGAIPSYYPVIRLPRVGKNGRLMYVYKIRTMHPYSEFIQDYIIRRNGYDENGRPANDIRITRWGRVFRNLRIDELPQFIQVILGRMKLTGLRPLSVVRFSEFPEDLKAERIRYKPGWIPPYVALNMPGEKQRIEAERIYLKEYKKSPLLTDLRYTGKACFNILFNKVRNKLTC